MRTHPFRFGVVAGHDLHPDAWGELGRRVEGLGFDTLLVPGPAGPLGASGIPDVASSGTVSASGAVASFGGLGAVAAATTTLRVGTYVVDAPSWTPERVARAAAGLCALSGGRFELGLGAAPPTTVDTPADRPTTADQPTTGDTPADQLKRLTRTVDAVRALPGADGVPVLIAVSCSGLLKVAAEKADTVALQVPPWCPEERVAAMLDELYELAGDRYDRLELHLSLAAVGASPYQGAGVLTGTVDQMAGVLLERRDKLGISYVSVNAQAMENFAPVVAMLSGT
ncbi:LLM class flavin-dependent oxidoreductase [Nonomuraea rhizosphaerae]|uniref:LLM class flavin-dependent oxidoreductase n=1 Tax=Nonomuraea rhizosphaerae TaxID=2665663 RepID=UPI001C5DADA0|nr:LLM class flavin-dependent oxidoreductase [Nonomuraea rhizosphaerae]